MLDFDPLHSPYASRRNVVYSHRGIVATSQPQAAQAGLHVLQAGGNAIDAAIATAAALTVVEPTANGIGGDAFALIWSQGRLHGLNASGPAPQAMTLDRMTALGHSEVPKYGPLPVTVPGTPAAWAAMAQRFGRLPLARSMAAAGGTRTPWLPRFTLSSFCLATSHQHLSTAVQRRPLQTLVSTPLHPSVHPGQASSGARWACPDPAIHCRDFGGKFLPLPTGRAHQPLCAIRWRLSE